MNVVKAMGLIVIGLILGYGSALLNQSTLDEIRLNKEIPTPQVSKQVPKIQIKNDITPSQSDKLIEKSVKQNNIKKVLSTNHEAMLKQDHQDLSEKYQALERKYNQSRSKISSLKHQLSEFDGSEVTDEEMAGLTPEPFKDFLSSFRGKTRNNIYDFHKKEQNLDWGYNTENNISDFVQTHYEGTSVELISVICKQPHCEILVTEKQDGAWGKIMKDISMQPWWKFSSTTSSSNNVYIYIFLSQ
ncbi:MAG: hypothetical protein HRT53_13590 [Colwellia sp.]|nr:hypothetical protein [Colwellia sp.]